MILPTVIPASAEKLFDNAAGQPSGLRDIQPAVYLLASRRNGTFYLAITSDLVQRVWQHREHLVDVFSKKYGVTRLVWFELHDTMESAITREKGIKKWRRESKI